MSGGDAAPGAFGHIHMLPPQSEDEVQAVERELRQLDRCLYVHWQPRARIVRPGTIDAYGRPTPITYDGRWEVRRRSDEGEDVLVWQVAWEAGEDGHDKGDYRALGEWLPRKMRLWDNENRAAALAYREKLWAEHDAAEAAGGMIDDAAAEDFFHEQAAKLDDAPGLWQGGVTT